VSQGRSTLFTSPVSQVDFLLRLLFFLAAPLGIVVVAELFPVRGALVDVGLALGVFFARERAHRLAERSLTVRWLLAEALEFEGFYRSRPPRPFLYYLLYPFLFPYWLLVRDARREFLVFRSYTGAGLLLLLGSLVWQYFRYWAPELGWRTFLPSVLLALLVETVLVLSLLMPIATTVVWYHSSLRRGRLAVLLLVGMLSTSAALAHVTLRKDPVVSWVTRQRVRLRTQAAPKLAHRAMVRAAHAAMLQALRTGGVDGEGRVDGLPLAKAQEALRGFFKPDEAAAFDLWASPRRSPKVLVLYFEARPHKPPIWVALGADGKELRKPSQLPKGAFLAMRRANGEDDALWDWPAEIDFDGE